VLLIFNHQPAILLNLTTSGLRPICNGYHPNAGATENAGVENAGLENAAPDCRGGKSGRSTVWKAEVSVI